MLSVVIRVAFYCIAFQRFGCSGFILVPWIHCFVYISKGLVTRGNIHFVFIIFVLESMLLQVVQVVLLLIVLLLVGFGDAVMYDGPLIWFKYEDDFGRC